MEFLETILHSFANLAILLFEYVGVIVITFSGIQGIVNYVRRRPDTRLVLAKGLAMGLEFKLGSEILRTVIVRSMKEIYIVTGIIVLRAILTVLIHWEIRNEEKARQAEAAGALADRPAGDFGAASSGETAAGEASGAAKEASLEEQGRRAKGASLEEQSRATKGESSEE